MIWYIVAGALFGIAGGMGLGGGIILIPALTIFFAMGQQNAQAVNLLAFIPMAVCAIILHLKNKLVDYKKTWPLIVGGCVGALPGSLIAAAISGDALRVIFGVFLILLGGGRAFKFIKDWKEKRKKGA